MRILRRGALQITSPTLLNTRDLRPWGTQKFRNLPMDGLTHSCAIESAGLPSNLCRSEAPILPKLPRGSSLQAGLKTVPRLAHTNQLLKHRPAEAHLHANSHVQSCSSAC